MSRSSRVPTIDDVAALARVSIATVSRVINGSEAVSPATRARVGEAIASLGFSPRATARKLAGGRSMMLGLLVPEISGDFFVSMLRGIEREAARRGYGLVVRTSPRPATSLAEALSLAGGLRDAVDGMLLFADCASDAMVSACDRSGLPAVLLYREAPEGRSCPSVTVENEEGAFAAVTHLVDLHGSKRPLFVAGPMGNHDAAARERGYRAALASRGLAFVPSLVVEGGFSRERAGDAVAYALRGGLRFDAIFAADDGSAFGTMDALEAGGLRVGSDIPVMGFDDVPAAALSRPGLSTVRSPSEELGATAVGVLVGHRAPDERERAVSSDENRERASSVVLKTELAIRESCGCRGHRGRDRA